MLAKTWMGLAAGCAALMLANSADARPFFHFFGDASGDFAGAAFSGAFDVVLRGNVANVVDSNPADARDGSYSLIVDSATFNQGGNHARLTGLYNNIAVNKSAAFPIIIFGQAQPAPTFFVAEGVVNSSLTGYDLRSAFGPVGSTPSAIVQTFFTDAGDLTFRSISALSFEATADAAPEPATWSMMLLGFGGLGTVLRTRRRTAAIAAQLPPACCR